MNLLDDVRRLLEGANIRYAVVGAAALAYRGVSRATVDVDLLTMDPRVIEASLWDSLSSRDAQVERRIGEPDDPLAAVVRLRRAQDREVDVILGRPAWQHEVIDRAELLGSGPDRVPVARVPDLILLKLYAGAPQDAWDIRQLLGESPDQEVVAEVDRRLSALPPDARTLWQRVQGG